ncbi:MAG: 30S ribosomal protein S6 [Candidatus Falkowbacteria bacterium]|nr:30S ribosomal protein S6 [Candidatus Falkowbacteria bacterium]
MSKVKQDAVGRFELLHIISNKFTDDEVKDLAQKINTIVTDQEGKIINTFDWGKKKLSYPIKKYSHGYYNLVIFDIDRKNILTISRLMLQMRDVLRFCIIKYIPPYEIKVGLPERREKSFKKEETVFNATPAVASATEESIETKVIIDTTKKPVARVTRKVAEKKPEAPTTSEDLQKADKSLDDKLDNILEAKDLF